MSPFVKFLTGLVAALLIGWIHHGPVGAGARYIDGIESQAKARVARAGVPGVEVRLHRDPLARVATLSGPADDFQREGQGELPGLNDLVSSVEGVSAIRWANPPTDGGPRIMPLILETLSLVAIAYLLGFLLGWLFLGRKKRETYL